MYSKTVMETHLSGVNFATSVLIVVLLVGVVVEAVMVEVVEMRRIWLLPVMKKNENKCYDYGDPRWVSSLQVDTEVDPHHRKLYLLRAQQKEKRNPKLKKPRRAHQPEHAEPILLQQLHGVLRWL